MKKTPVLIKMDKWMFDRLKAQSEQEQRPMAVIMRRALAAEFERADRRREQAQTVAYLPDGFPP